jgi:uncharacterized protein YlxW (UPF0749 family)
VLVLPALLLGVLVATQWQTQSRRTPLASRNQIQLAEAAQSLQSEQAQLKAQVVQLRAQLDAIDAQTAAFGGQSAVLKTDLDRLRGAAGLSPVTGPGLTVTLDDGRVPAGAPTRNIELAIVHSTDLTDVFNAAWRGGAEAVAVNGERITGSSACVGAVIQINGTLLSPPFVVQIIGPTEQLLAAFNDPRVLADQKQRRTSFGLGFSVGRADRLEVPAFSGAVRVSWATTR